MHHLYSCWWTLGPLYSCQKPLAMLGGSAGDNYNYMWSLPLSVFVLTQLRAATNTMSAKYGLVGYNNSRKHISISIPSSTEVMSPHIKSLEELRVLGINLSSFSAPTQFFICVAGVFLFYLIYGYLQVKLSGMKKRHNMKMLWRVVLQSKCVAGVMVLWFCLYFTK